MELLLLIWIICGVVHYGLWVGYFQKEYPRIAYEGRIQDRIWGLVTALAGPAALLVTVLLGVYKHGWKL